VSSFNCIVALMRMAVPRTLISTLVYALYSLTRSNTVWVTSCNRIMSITCLWRNSVRISILIIADMPLINMVPFLCFRQYIRKRRQNNEVFPILVSTWLSIRSYLYFWSHILSSKPFILGRFELAGCDAFKQYVSASDGCLSAINTPTSTSPVPLPST